MRMEPANDPMELTVGRLANDPQGPPAARRERSVDGGRKMSARPHRCNDLLRLRCLAWGLAALPAAVGCAPVHLDYSFFVQIHARAENVEHQPLEGVTVLFTHGWESRDLGSTDSEGILVTRQAFMQGRRMNDKRPPGPLFTLVFRKVGFRDEVRPFFAKDLQHTDEYDLLRAPVILVERAASDQAAPLTPQNKPMN